MLQPFRQAVALGLEFETETPAWEDERFEALQVQKELASDEITLGTLS